MSDFKPTHRSRGGVEVVATPDGGCTSIAYQPGTSEHQCQQAQLLTSTSFKVLFEPIPKSVMVEIPLLLARHLTVQRPWGAGDAVAYEALQAAIAAAEMEADGN